MQVIAVVLGHVVGAWLGHSAVRRERQRARAVSQWPLAALMIAMTVLALWSLGQNLVFVAETSRRAGPEWPAEMVAGSDLPPARRRGRALSTSRSTRR